MARGWEERKRKEEEMDIGMRWRTDDVTLPAFFHCFQSTLGRFLYFFSYIHFSSSGLEVLRYTKCVCELVLYMSDCLDENYCVVDQDGRVSGRA